MAKTGVIWTMLFVSAVCFAETIVVDPNGFADFTTIQEAINYSWDGDTVIVRPSTYNEAIAFNGRAITLTSTNPDDSSVVSSTIIATTSGTAVNFNFGEGPNSVITGFTITGYVYGIYCYATAPLITKNIIINCRYTGIYGRYNSVPTISGNKIINNGTVTGNGEATCGISGCNGLIYNNIISGNTNKRSHSGGGGLTSCNGTIMNNIISGNRLAPTNSSGDNTGGGGLAGCNGTIINNTIVGNDATPATGGDGGGIFNCYGTVKNNIIAFNKAASGGGIYNNSAGCNNSYNTLWLNVNGNFGGNITPAIGDTVRDPLFVTSGYWSSTWVDGDYHLKSSAGRWTGAEWVLDSVDSPCIDTGDPSDPVGIELNPNGGRINIGAYGSTVEASKSPSGIVVPVCSNPPSMDTNGDCKIDITDFAEFASQWMNCGLDPQSACWE